MLPATASAVEWVPVANGDCAATCSSAGKAAVDSGGSGNQLCMYQHPEYKHRYIGEPLRAGGLWP